MVPTEAPHHGPGAARAEGAEQVVPTEAPQQGPGRRQILSNKDQGAGSRCEILTEASGTEETAKKSPPLLVSAQAGEGSWITASASIFNVHISDFQFLKIILF